MATRTPPTAQDAAVPLSATPCDARCPAMSLVMVEGGGAVPADVLATGTPHNPTPGVLTFCAHHYREHAILLAAHGWRIVADLRTWKEEG